jgi:hypothetical protein
MSGRLVSSPIEANSYLVRVHPDSGPHYKQMIVVTELEDGLVLHLYGWIGKPLTPKEWIAARNQLFPKAIEVRFERLRKDGTFKPVALRLPPVA